jgi:hypothetical protein
MSTFPRLLWADLHNHNEVGYGQGTIERSYRIARNTLDVYALTAHGHWPDPPQDDPTLVQYHTEGLRKAGAAFPELVRQANDRYLPGEFVTLIGYEWHSTAWGDYVVLFPDDSGELCAAENLSVLQKFVRSRGAIMIPHHVAYSRGCRGLDWGRVDFGLSPLVEIFSEHGSSWEPDGLGPMLGHSMGGSTASQTVLRQLAGGAHFGFTAGTDTHFGYPGSYGEGLTGIYAGELSRESVFDALRHRRTVAVTGDRIEIGVDSGGALPGEVMPTGAAREFSVRVDPLGPLDYLEVIKNGVRADFWPGRPQGSGTDDPGPFMLRIEWGWGRMGAADETDWAIRIGMDGGEIRRVIPCLGGGAASVGKMNLIRPIDAQNLEIDSFTSRRNPLSVNGVVLELAGSAGTAIDCRVEATVEGRAGGCEFGATVAELRRDDVWGVILPRMSSPRLRLGRAWTKSELGFESVYRDPNPGHRDTYIFKARQTNGQTVWTSPYLFAE